MGLLYCGPKQAECSPHAFDLVLAAEDAVGLPWVVEARMGAAFSDDTLADHFGLLFTCRTVQ